MARELQVSSFIINANVIESGASTDDGKLAKWLEVFRKSAKRSKLFSDGDYESVKANNFTPQEEYTKLLAEHGEYKKSNGNNREKSLGFVSRFRTFFYEQIEGAADYVIMQQCFNSMVDLLQDNLEIAAIQTLFDEVTQKLREKGKITQASYLISGAYLILHNKLSEVVWAIKNNYVEEFITELQIDETSASIAVSLQGSLASAGLIGQDWGVEMRLQQWAASPLMDKEIKDFCNLLLSSPEKQALYCEKIKEIEEYVSSVSKDTEDLLKASSKQAVSLYREGLGEPIQNARLLMSGLIGAGKGVNKKDIGVLNYNASDVNFIMRNQVTGDAEVIAVDKTISADLIKTRLDHFIKTQVVDNVKIEDLEINLIGCTTDFNAKDPSTQDAKDALRKVLSVCFNDSKNRQDIPQIRNVELFNIDTPDAYVISLAPGELQVKKGIAAEKPDYFLSHYAVTRSESAGERVTNLAFNSTKGPYNPYFVTADTRASLKSGVKASRAVIADIEKQRAGSTPVSLVFYMEGMNDFRQAIHRFDSRNFFVPDGRGSVMGAAPNAVSTALQRKYLHHKFDQMQMNGIYQAIDIPGGFFIGAGASELNEKAYASGFTKFDTKTRCSPFIKISDKGMKLELDTKAVEAAGKSLLAIAKSQRAENVGFAGKVKSGNKQQIAR